MNNTTCNTCGECAFAQDIDANELFCHIEESMVGTEAPACAEFEDEEFGVYA